MNFFMEKIPWEKCRKKSMGFYMLKKWTMVTLGPFFLKKIEFLQVSGNCQSLVEGRNFNILHNKANRCVQFSANHHWICLKRPLGLTWGKSFSPIFFPTRFSGGSHPSHKVDDARDPIPSKFHQNRCSRLGASKLLPISGPVSETPPQTRQSQLVFQ